jgi:predicted nucleic acid-binding protein
LDEIISKFNIIKIHSESLLERYVEIDAFSQGKHPNFTLEVTSRNMGKHDLWISATASLLGLNLVTTDADFDHLAHDFVQLHKFTPQELILKNNL